MRQGWQVGGPVLMLGFVSVVSFPWQTRAGAVEQPSLPIWVDHVMKTGGSFLCSKFCSLHAHPDDYKKCISGTCVRSRNTKLALSEIGPDLVHEEFKIHPEWANFTMIESVAHA